jgi:hypothetical protein
LHVLIKKVIWGAGKKTRLRGQLSAVDPMNLNQVILAEGKNGETKKSAIN